MAERAKVDPTRIEKVTSRVVLRGTVDVMFDRYAGDNQTRLEWFQKLYLGRDGETICLPSLNLMSFLSAHNTNSAPKRLLDARQFKKVANACLSYLSISPMLIPFTREGQPIKFGKIPANAETDPVSGVYLHRAVARLDKGIPNPKERPVLPVPWDLAFDLTIFPNQEIKEQQIINLIEAGGRAIGLGTFRGVYGKFEIIKWE
jgi:hypothetical protein